MRKAEGGAGGAAVDCRSFGISGNVAGNIGADLRAAAEGRRWKAVGGGGRRKEEGAAQEAAERRRPSTAFRCSGRAKGQDASDGAAQCDGDGNGNAGPVGRPSASSLFV